MRDDYKSDQSVAEVKRKQLRESARKQQEAEWAEADRQAEEGRQKREQARLAVKAHLESLHDKVLLAQKITFLEVFDLNPEENLSELETTLLESFYDWIAEQENL